MIAVLFRRFWMDGHDGLTVGEMDALIKRLHRERQTARQKKRKKAPKIAVSEQKQAAFPATKPATILPDYGRYIERLFQLEGLITGFDRAKREAEALALLQAEAEHAAQSAALDLLRKEAKQQVALAHARNLAERLAVAQIVRAVEQQEEEMLISLLNSDD